MATLAPLIPAEEDALHKSRLLNNEEKHFKRITKHLLSSQSVLTTLRPTPQANAPAADEAVAAREAERLARAAEHQKWREDVLLDFANFESSIARIQYLRRSNEQERERYAAEKIKILQTAQAVRESTAQLRLQLEEAQKTLALRKTYDELAEKITSNRLLRPREDQEANLAKLNAEIAELERESREYAQTWTERREQFGRIVKEGMELRRLIRDEKEEVERREGMEEREEGEEGEVGTQKETESAFGTPMPYAVGGGATPLHSTNESERMERSSSEFLKVPQAHTDRSPARSGSQVPSPAKESDKTSGTPEDDDTEMIEQGEIAEDDDGEPISDESPSADMEMSEDVVPMGNGSSTTEEKEAAARRDVGDGDEEVDQLETGDTMDTN
ncbi:hypothetical protein GP486_005121 [Trichoglossum hirsutum]|uniref:Tho complex subunit 7 n=1 Tax=Trichoglossum hirsutum TaxID=265104 RepID=A0A9P8L9V5_9PEZI|nr:hypothetical protein GP486_005121 [Trichoglossum hirsutum]